ncbi:MAG: hypothetical protein HQK67_10995 [Desulfamplus sp.]|nr:hypothetical protein [Desulfamplus sp.]
MRRLIVVFVIVMGMMFLGGSVYADMAANYSFSDNVNDHLYAIYYDDGISDGATSPWSDQYGSEIAVRFDAPSYPARLNKIRFYITSWNEPSTRFGVYIYLSFRKIVCVNLSIMA